MKFTHGILSCALASGLVGFAAQKAQASNDVINNVLYAPVNLKISATFDVNGKTKKATLTSKVLLTEILDFSKGDQLAVSANTGDVWVIDKNGLVEDLTAEGIATVNTHQTGGTVKGDTETETGSTEIDFYDDPQFGINGLDKSASEDASGNWFEITGTYTLKQSEGKDNSKGFFKESDDFSSKDLTGTGFFDEAESSTVPITKSSVSAKGSGSIED